MFESWRALYYSQSVGVWTLVVQPVLLLGYIAWRGFAPGLGIEPFAARFVRVWTVVFALETIFDPIATGVLGWSMLPFVAIGDYRVFALVLVVMQPGRSRVSALAEALAWTAVVPAIAVGVHRGLGVVMGPRPEAVLWIAYESAFALLAVFLIARVVPARVGVERAAVRRYLRRVLALVVVYYALWATADVLIFAGHENAWALRFAVNLLYYGTFVPAAYALFFPAAASSTSSQAAR